MPERQSRDEVCMSMAEVIAARGTCSRAQVGVVIAHDGRVVVSGYNGAPAGLAHCDHTCDCNAFAGEWHDRLCASQQGCTVAVHAEANAIAYAARHGISTYEADLFSTHAPCLECARLIVNAGIERVIYHTPYRLTAGLELLLEAGVEVQQL